MEVYLKRPKVLSIFFTRLCPLPSFPQELSCLAFAYSSWVGAELITGLPIYFHDKVIHWRITQKIGNISSSQSHPNRHCYHSAKKTKMLVARVLSLQFPPSFYLLLFLFKRETRGWDVIRSWSPEGLSPARLLPPSRPSQAPPCAAGPLPGDARAQVHVRQPLLLPRLRALLPGPDR